MTQPSNISSVQLADSINTMRLRMNSLIINTNQTYSDVGNIGSFITIIDSTNISDAINEIFADTGNVELLYTDAKNCTFAINEIYSSVNVVAIGDLTNKKERCISYYYAGEVETGNLGAVRIPGDSNREYTINGWTAQVQSNMAATGTTVLKLNGSHKKLNISNTDLTANFSGDNLTINGSSTVCFYCNTAAGASDIQLILYYE